MTYYVYNEDRNLWFCGSFDSYPVWADEKHRKYVASDEAKAAAERLGGLFRFYPADKTNSGQHQEADGHTV